MAKKSLVEYTCPVKGVTFTCEVLREDAKTYILWVPYNNRFGGNEMIISKYDRSLK